MSWTAVCRHSGKFGSVRGTADLGLQLCELYLLACRFFPDLEWYVDTMITLIERAGEFATKDVWHSTVQLVRPPCLVTLPFAPPQARGIFGETAPKCVKWPPKLHPITVLSSAAQW